MSYVIGSGWWSAPPQEDSRHELHGDPEIRTTEFHGLWRKAIRTFSDPTKIVIVDSDSPRKPPREPTTDVEWIELPFNAGHAKNHRGQWSGWSRSVLLGLMYAVVSDAEYFVYVEQDALLFGDRFIEECISEMRRPYMFGSGDGTPQVLQQSVFIIRRDGMLRFMHRIAAIAARDADLSPEYKFAFAASRVPIGLANLAGRSPAIQRLAGIWFKRVRPFDELPFDGGRARPLDMSASHFYFQWGDGQELDSFKGRLGGGE